MQTLEELIDQLPPELQREVIETLKAFFAGIGLSISIDDMKKAGGIARGSLR